MKKDFIGNLPFYFLGFLLTVHIVYFIAVRNVQALILLLALFLIVYVILKNKTIALILTLLLVDTIYYIKREGFSGSLNISDLYDLSAVNETLPPIPTVPAATKQASNVFSYTELYNNLFSNYSTPGPTVTTGPTVTPGLTASVSNSVKNTPIYKTIYTNTLSDNTYITSPGMKISMTEYPKITGKGLSSQDYSTLYKSALSKN